MRLDAAAAIAALPQLLSRAAPADIELLGSMLERLLTASGPLDAAAQERLREVKTVLADAARQATDVIRPGPGARRPDCRSKEEVVSCDILIRPTPYRV